MSLDSLKDQIKALVDTKVALTRQRRDYKFNTRPELAEKREKANNRKTQDKKAQKQAASLFYSYAYKRDLWFIDINGKRTSLKTDIRHALLAYGYLRGMNYKRIERKCGEDNPPIPYKIFHFIRMFDGYATESMIEDWLAGETMGRMDKSILEGASEEQQAVGA